MKNIRLWIVAASLSLTSCSTPAISSLSNDSVAEQFYKKGTMALQRGNYKDAIGPLTEAIDQDHQFVAAYINRAKTYNELKQFKEALADATSALKYNDTSSYAFFQRARAEEGLARYVDAANDWKQAAKDEPEQSYQYLMRAAKCLDAGGQKTEAESLKKTLLSGGSPEFCVGRGVAHYHKNQFAEAIKDYDLAIAAAPAFAPAYYERALAEAALMHFDKALSDYNKTLSLDQNQINAYYIRGVDKFCLGDYRGAMEDLHYHYSHNDQSEAHSNYSVIVSALAYRKLGFSTKQLLEWWQPYQGTKWPLPVLNYLMGKISAADVMKEAGSDNDKITEAKTYIGINDELTGRYKEAIDYLTWVHDYGNKQFSEYQLAVAELERMRKPHAK